MLIWLSYPMPSFLNLRLKICPRWLQTICLRYWPNLTGKRLCFCRSGCCSNHCSIHRRNRCNIRLHSIRRSRSTRDRNIRRNTRVNTSCYSTMGCASHRNTRASANDCTTGCTNGCNIRNRNTRGRTKDRTRDSSCSSPFRNRSTCWNSIRDFRNNRNRYRRLRKR